MAHQNQSFCGFLAEHFGVDNEIIESRMTGRAYLLRRRRGMPCLGGIMLIIIGCILTFIFAPQSGDTTFGMIGVVLIIVGAVSIAFFTAWLYYKYTHRNDEDINAPMVEAHAHANPVHAYAENA